MGPFPPPDAARRASALALFLDFDGTLVDLAPTPGAIAVPDALRQHLLAARAALGGALALITGRPLAEIDRFLAPARFAGAGEHGAALRHRPEEEAAPLPGLPRVPEAWRAASESLAARFPGVLVEHKRAGITLHHRAAPAAAAPAAALLSALAAEAPGFRVVPAHAAWELRPRGVDKGEALRRLMAAPPFAGRRPIFVGDDATDEDAIAAAIALGGAGYRVAEAFGDPAGVRRWLAGFASVAPA